MSNNIVSARKELKDKLMEKLQKKDGKHKYNEFFMSSKNPKKMLQSFRNYYDNELSHKSTHNCMLSVLIL